MRNSVTNALVTRRVTEAVTAPRPDPTRPVPCIGPKAPSMTSGRGWRATAASTRQAVSASVMDGGFAATDTDVDLSDLDALDGLHHAWCGRCYPQWTTRSLGAELGVPFIAWCGQRAVFLAVWQSHELPPGEVCAGCWVEPIAPCATCGLVA